MERRVCFYSEHDMSIGYNLSLAEEAIERYKSIAPANINEIVELYHIKKLYDLNLTYTEEALQIKFEQLKNSTKDYNAKIVTFFQSIPKGAIVAEYNKLDWRYHQTFWDIIEQFKLSNLISNDECRKIISSKIYTLELILRNKSVTNKFNGVIKDLLTTHTDSAHILIKKYILTDHSPSDRYIFLPNNISVQEKEEIIINYLDSVSPNLNYVRLIEQAKNIANKFTIGVKTRLKAKRVAEKLNDEFINDSRTSIINTSIKIEFSNQDDIPPVAFEDDDQGNFAWKYSIKHLLSFDYRGQIKECASLFGWINNHQCMIDLISKSSEVDGLEHAMTTMSKDSYPYYRHFNFKNDLSSVQLYLFNCILQDSANSIESNLKKYYEDYLKHAYGYPSMALNIPTQVDLTLNKCRIILPELDSIIKQYNTYIYEDEIDPDYIRLLKPLKLTDGKSLLQNKYYEIKDGNNEIWRILHNLFASGSLLGHVDPHKDKGYSNLFELLQKEIVEYKNYEDHQKAEIDYLVQHNILHIADTGCISFVNFDEIIALLSLWEYRACSYWHCNENGRDALDNMLSKGWVTTNEHLLTTEEQKYFSYYLDNQEFTNGLAYRNHYAHGSSPSVDDENAHRLAYMVFLRLLIFLILKIDDDLQLACKALAIGDNRLN